MLFRRPINCITSALLFAAALCLLAPARVAQQQEPKAKDQKGQKEQNENPLRIETELVQIDIVVSNQKGVLVGDLKREDFELLEDGRPQSITHFAVGTSKRPATWLTAERKSPATEPAGKAVTTEVPGGRYLILAVDDIHLVPENLILAKRALLRFIDQQMASGDQVAVVTTSGALGFFQQFTGERPVLERAIQRLTVQNRAVPRSLDVPRISDYQAELIDLGDHDALELAVQEILSQEGQPTVDTSGGAQGRGGGRSGQQNQGGFSPGERAAAQAQAKARMIVAENAHFTTATLSTLEEVIRSLRPLPGRKVLVLLSDGFFLGGSRNSKHYDLRRLTDAATRAGVVIYSIDARGLVATPPGGDASEPSGVNNALLPGIRARIEQGVVEAKRDGLNALARDTGGFPVFNNNDLNLGLQRVLDDNETYYVLAFEPATSYRDGRFHKLEVRVKGQPGLRVRTRAGYFAPAEKLAEKSVEKKEKSPEKAAQQAKAARDAQFRAGLGSLFPLRGIPLDLAADFMNISEASNVALVTAHIDTAGLNFERTNDLYRTTLDLVGLVFDEKGKVAGSFTDHVDLSLKPDLFERVVKNGVSYRKLVALKPGLYQVRMAVRQEGTGQLGSASQWVEVSDLSKKQLTLSSLMLSPGGEDLNLSLPAAQQTEEKVAAYQPRPSEASRRFKRGTNLDFFLFVYNAKVDAKGATDLVIQSQVFSGSKLIYATPLSRIAPTGAPDVQRVPYAARLSLASFDPGNYELRALVIDRAAKTTAHRRINFTVE